MVMSGGMSCSGEAGGEANLEEEEELMVIEWRGSGRNGSRATLIPYRRGRMTTHSIDEFDVHI
jgi:hypothetical protein